MNVLLFFLTLMWCWIVVIWVHYWNDRLSIIIILGLIIIINVGVSTVIGRVIIWIIIVYGLVRFIIIFVNYFSAVSQSESETNFWPAASSHGAVTIDYCVRHWDIGTEMEMDEFSGVLDNPPPPVRLMFHVGWWLQFSGIIFCYHDIHVFGRKIQTWCGNIFAIHLYACY